MSGDSSDSESEHWGLFHVRDSADEVFYFERISIDEFDHDALVVQFVFSYCGEDEFTSDLRVDHIGTVMSDELYRTLFDIGMCVMTWYWMGYGCRNIVVSHDVASLAGVDERTIGYWRESYNNILAEYIYENKLSFHSVNLTYQSWDSRMSSGASQCIGCQAPRSACYEDIVPLGGGKDSLVVWHLVSSRSSRPPLWVYVSDGFDEYQLNSRLEDIVSSSRCDKLIVKHEFHYQSIATKGRSYRNPCGHPWAALVLFDCLLVAHCLPHESPLSIHLGHEKSADEGNNVFLSNGLEVNHQYDKSAAFVALTEAYLTPISTRISTPLAKLYELEIVRLFCEEQRLQTFHKLFLSCNEPIMGSRWCMKCDKCAFIYVLFSAFLSPEQMKEIFCRDMFAEESLVPTFLRLVGRGDVKPFDCVGTVEEAKAAVLLACRWHFLGKGGAGDLPVVLEEMRAYCGFPDFSQKEFWDVQDFEHVAHRLKSGHSRTTSNS